MSHSHTHRRSICYCFTALILLTITVLPAIRVPAADTLKLAVLAPITGPNYSIGEQVVAGVELAAEQMPTISNIVVSVNWEGDNIEAGLTELNAQDVDAIIASVPPHQVDQFIQVISSPTLQDQQIPILFLAFSHYQDKIEALKAYDNVNSFGYTYDGFTQLALSTWAEILQLNEPVIVYDTQDYFQELREISESALKHFSQDGTVKSLPFSDISEALAATDDTDGIVLIGHPAQVPKYMEMIKWESYDMPVFLTGIYAGWSVGNTSSYSFPGVYYGTMWSPEQQLESDEHISQVLSDINERLGWQPQAFSSFALDAYGAVKVVEARWRELQDNPAHYFEEFWQGIADGEGAKWLIDEYHMGFSSDAKGIVPGGFLSEMAGAVKEPFDGH